MERTLTASRIEQGFTSQAQLDAFFAHYDHVLSCGNCHEKDASVLLVDGYQLISGECEQAQKLYREYMEASNARA